MKWFFNNILGVQSKLSYFVTLLTRANFIGVDQDGNRYYTGKARKGYKTERRFVKFKSGIVESTQVPPEFHAWLHHQTNDFPDVESSAFRKSWQKPHTQNLTGTDLAYRPPGHMLKDGQRQRATGDYEAWIPE